MNMIAIMGRLTKEPEIRTAQNGNSVARFGVAVDFFKGKEKATDYFNCVAFGNLADNIQKYFRKGDQIGITGTIHQDKYKDKSGNDRADWAVYVHGFDFGAKKNNDTPKAETANTGNFDAEIDDSDFPF